LANLPLREFAIRQLAERLTRVEFEWGRCAECSGADEIHDLRVSLRRFAETLWLFRRLFPSRERKLVRAELKTVLGFAGDTRDVDIAFESFKAAGITLPPEVRLYLESARAASEAGLVATLAVGLRTFATDRWRRSLGLQPNPLLDGPIEEGGEHGFDAGFGIGDASSEEETSAKLAYKAGPLADARGSVLSAACAEPRPSGSGRGLPQFGNTQPASELASEAMNNGEEAATPGQVKGEAE
jgi:hypothetical protein